MLLSVVLDGSASRPQARYLSILDLSELHLEWQLLQHGALSTFEALHHLLHHRVLVQEFFDFLLSSS